MGQNGEAALKAVELVVDEDMSPQDAWKKAICEFTDSQSSQDKACPREAFLGLCEEGMIIGVQCDSCSPGKKNKAHATEAVRILQKDKSQIDNKTKLWKKVMKKLGEKTSKSQNGQMDVVTTLWNNKLIAMKHE